MNALNSVAATPRSLRLAQQQSRHRDHARCMLVPVAGDELAILGQIAPKDWRPWCLDLPGAIVSDRRVTPMVEVSLTPFVQNTLPARERERYSSLDLGQRVKGIAAVSDFGFLRVGSLWVDGIPQRDFPEYECRQFHIDVLRSKATFYRACHSAETLSEDGAATRRFVIPPFIYQIPYPNSQLVALPVGPQCTLLIPCSEIFRFYYCGISGKFGTAILDGTYSTQRSKIVNETASSWPDEHGVAVLRRGSYVNDTDVIEIARTTFSPYARAASDAIFQGMALKRKAYIQALPPFEGRTTLSVRGIAFKGALGPTFLAFIIERCTAPMPFRHLIFERDNEPYPNQSDDTAIDRKKARSLRAPAPQLPEAQSYTQQADPDADQRATLLRGFLSSFRYRTSIEVKYRAREAVTKSPHGTSREQNLEGSYASGTRRAGAPAHPVEFTEEVASQEQPIRNDGDPRHEPLQLNDFWLTLQQIDELYPDLTVCKFGEYSFPERIGAKLNRRRSWQFIGGRIKKRLRLAAVATVQNTSALHILIEIERQPSDSGKGAEHFQTVVFRSNADFILDDDAIREFLTFLMKCRGSIGKEIPPQEIGGRTWSISGIWHWKKQRTASVRAKAIYVGVIDQLQQRTHAESLLPAREPRMAERMQSPSLGSGED